MPYSAITRKILPEVEDDNERLEVLVQLVGRTGTNFARRYQKQNLFLREECKAEALYWLGLFLTVYSDRIMDHPEPLAYIRKTIGKKLISYVRFNKDMNYHKLPGSGNQLAEIHCIANTNSFTNNLPTDTDLFIVLESVLKTEIDWSIYELKVLGQNADVIGKRLEIPTIEVKRTLSQIRNRLSFVRKTKYYKPHQRMLQGKKYDTQAIIHESVEPQDLERGSGEVLPTILEGRTDTVSTN